MTKKKIFVSAFNINSGGGLILLKDFLGIKKINFLLDNRIKKSLNKNQKNYDFVEKFLFFRIFKFINFCRKVKKTDILVCFNNLPPLIKTNGKVILFIQSSLYFEKLNCLKNNLYECLKLILEKYWISYGIKNCDEVFVQTIGMKKKIKLFLDEKKIKKKIFIKPLLDNVSFKKLQTIKKNTIQIATLKNQSTINIFYPSFYYNHKNHVNLLKSLIYFKSNQKLNLYLTITKNDLDKCFNKFPEINEGVKNKIYALGNVSKKKINILYKKCDLVIFPSIKESFGLPLIEAMLFKKPLMVPNLPYIKDIFSYVPKNMIFDPFSPSSISRKLLLNLNKFNNKKKLTYIINKNTAECLCPSQFLKEIDEYV